MQLIGDIEVPQRSFPNFQEKEMQKEERRSHPPEAKISQITTPIAIS